MLGHVMKGYEHVHFTEIDHGRIVNRSQRAISALPGTGPRRAVISISFRESDTGPESSQVRARPFVVLIAAGVRHAGTARPGDWIICPVAPVVLTWRVESAKDGKVVLREQTAFDVRLTLPNKDFWQCYARGTRQNMSNFNGQRAWRETGVYLYKLTGSPSTAPAFPTASTRCVSRQPKSVAITARRARSSSSATGGACEAPAVDHRERVRGLCRSGLAAGGAARPRPGWL